MTFPDFIPIEFEGMSIITAIFFFFSGLAACYVHTLIRHEFDNIYTTLSEHDVKIEEFRDTLSPMKTDIALLLQSVKRIEQAIEKL